ncbi:MAG: winged helix-turn-helix domain-containing protein, partial [Steroidobacteraceae bacterium]
MRFWWVNQNQTWRQEVGGGYLWSPKRKANNQINPFYESMREVSPGDVILSFRDTLIAAIGIAYSHDYECPKPQEFGDAAPNWGNIGWKIDVRFVDLVHKIRPKNHIDELRRHLPRKYSPLSAAGDGSQSVYLTEVPEPLFRALARLIGLEAEQYLDRQSKAFDALVYLVEHAGEALDKDTLLKGIWPGAVVEENKLTQVISSLRQLLGEERGENRYIATLPRKGYRFVAEVRRRESLAPMQPRKRRGQWLSGVALLLLAAFAIGAVVLQLNQSARTKAPVRTLAILPFKPLVPEQGNPSLEFGMADSLISQLAQRSDQVVSPLSAVRSYAAVDQDALAAGRELKVDSVLDGLMQRQGDHLRVSVRLLRVADGRQLWTQTFDQPFTDIFQVQD